MLKIKDWLTTKKDKHFEVVIERGAGNFKNSIYFDKRIVVIKRLSDGRQYNDSSIAFVRGKKYRIREFYYDFKTVRLQWEYDEIICDINELYN